MSDKILSKAVVDLLFDLRSNMTSITRYVNHDRAKHPNLTDGQFLDRHLKYKDFARTAVNNILRCINQNDELDSLLKERLKQDSDGQEGAEKKIKALEAFKEYFDGLYGEGLEVANWHQNGNTEAFDNFYDDAMEEYVKIIEEDKK